MRPSATDLQKKNYLNQTYLLEILVVVRNLQEISEKKTTILIIKRIKLDLNLFNIMS